MKGLDGVWQLGLKRTMGLSYIALAISAGGAKGLAGLDELDLRCQFAAGNDDGNDDGNGDGGVD